MKSNKKKQVVNQEELIKLYRKALAAGVSLDKIEAKVSKLVMRSTVVGNLEDDFDQESLVRLKNKTPKLLRVGATFLPLFFLLIGIFLIGSVTMPIMGYYINDLPTMRAQQLASPIPQDQVLDVNPILVARANTEEGEFFGTAINDDSGPVIINAKLDYTNLSNWFTDLTPSVEARNMMDQEESEYILEIPKLDIFNAVVKVGGTDLNESLIHYEGTAPPGQLGSPVIFGHSILRQFYNPKETNPRRYKSIFSTIMTLQKGDEIHVIRGNVKYTYVVQDKTEVQPTDVYILNQQYDERKLKLVTCVPEGTYLRRGVITAQLIN